MSYLHLGPLGIGTSSTDKNWFSNIKLPVDNSNEHNKQLLSIYYAVALMHYQEKYEQVVNTFTTNSREYKIKRVSSTIL